MLCGGRGPGSFVAECIDNKWAEETDCNNDSDCQEVAKKKCEDLSDTVNLCKRTEIKEPAWDNPTWPMDTYETQFNQFFGEVALGDAFLYPEVTNEYEAGMQPDVPKVEKFDKIMKKIKLSLSQPANITLANTNFDSWWAPRCPEGQEHCKRPEKESVTKVLDNYNIWFHSRSTSENGIAFGGGVARNQDKKDYKNGNRTYPRCNKRCQAWCEESCGCNWMWDSPWANSSSVGWKHRHAMRYRWSSQAAGWQCQNARNEPYECPKDNVNWRFDSTLLDSKRYTGKICVIGCPEHIRIAATCRLTAMSPPRGSRVT